MPKIGELKVFVNNNKYSYRIWSACIDCGKERWVNKYKIIPRCSYCSILFNAKKRIINKKFDNNPIYKLGITKRGYEIGRANKELYIYKICTQCNIAKWFRLKSPLTVCIPCKLKILRQKYPDIPPILNKPPKFGDVIRGKYIGKNTSVLYHWEACIDCGKGRWVNHSIKSRPIARRCIRCANIARLTHRPFNNIPPKENEIRRGDEIGRRQHASYIWRICSNCNSGSWISTVKGKPENKLCKKCKGVIYSRSNSHCWKGGITHTRSGYILIAIYPNNPYYSMGHVKSKKDYRVIFEHRLVMAQHLGRCLTKDEIVHHKNGIKSDNRLENLELTTKQIHIVDHNKGYQDGYNKGYEDGQNAKINQLLNHIKLLEFHLRESGIINTQIIKHEW